MQNLPPRPLAAVTLRRVNAALLLCAAALSLLLAPARAQQPKPAPATQPSAQSRELTHTDEAKVAVLPSPNKRYAVIIGIDKYDSNNITALSGAAGDATRLAGALEKYAGFPHDNIYILTSDQKDADMQPTRTHILNTLANLSGAIGKDGMLWVAFSGHGVDEGGTAYLLPQDAANNRSIIKTVSISVPDLTDLIKSTGAGQVLLMLDACRDDPFATNKGVASANPMDASFKSAESSFKDKNSGIRAFVTLYAAKEGQTAWEDKKNKKGYFTDALIDALSGAAGPSDNGDVTLDSIIRYLHEQVPLRVRRGVGPNTIQEPTETINSFDAARLVISRVAPKPKAEAVANSGGAVGGPIGPVAPPVPTTGLLSYTSVPGAKLRLEPVGGCGSVKESALPDDQRGAQVTDIKPCDYDAVAMRDGYETVKKRVKIVAGKMEFVDLSMNVLTFPVTVTANVAAGSISYRAVGEANKHVAAILDSKGTLGSLPKGTYEYEVKTDDADFQPQAGTFNVPEVTAISVKLERTSTALFLLSTASQLNPADWSAPDLLVKNTPPMWLNVGGSGVTYLRDDKYQHYADFKLDLQSVRLTNEIAATFVVRAQDQKNYYLIQLTGAKAGQPYRLRTAVVRGGATTELASVAIPEKYREMLKPPTQMSLTISMTGQTLSVTLHNQSNADDFSFSGVLDPANTFPKGGVGLGSVGGEKFEVGLFQVCSGAKCGGQ